MGEERDAVVFRTSQPGEIPELAGRLADEGIPFEVRIVVQPEREEQAVSVIESYMRSIGAAPNEEPASDAEAESLLPCPNCEAPGIALNKKCGSCGYAIARAEAAPTRVAAHVPGARTFCPECRDPLTFASGKCARCGEELEPLESGDGLCPSLAHVLYRDTVGGIVCKACERVWVDVAAG